MLNQASIAINHLSASRFLGYEKISCEAKLLGIIYDNETVNSLDSKSFKQDGTKNCILIFDQTVFYAEAGGQVGDSGIITSDGVVAHIHDTQKKDNIILHYCSSWQGRLLVSNDYLLTVEEERRNNICKHHSATHLLNAGLRNTFGSHTKQSGSLVDSEYLRFDFTVNRRPTYDELCSIEDFVNQAIRTSSLVDTKIMPKEEAETIGAVMTFGEKYGRQVRVVSMGEHSLEFCGGTHVANVADIGLFLITKESSVSALNRRIEAVAGEKAYLKIHEIKNKNIEILSVVDNLFSKDNHHPDELKTRFSTFKQEVEQYSKNIDNPFDALARFRRMKQLEKELNQLLSELKKKQKKEAKKEKTTLSKDTLQEVLNSFIIVNNKKLCFFLAKNKAIPELKSLADQMRDTDRSIIYLLQSVMDNQEDWNMVVATSRHTAQEMSLDLNKVVRLLLPKITVLHKSGGGGRSELAQASGKLLVNHACNIEQEVIQAFSNIISTLQK